MDDSSPFLDTWPDLAPGHVDPLLRSLDALDDAVRARGDALAERRRSEPPPEPPAAPAALAA